MWVRVCVALQWKSQNEKSTRNLINSDFCNSKVSVLCAFIRSAAKPIGAAVFSHTNQGGEQRRRDERGGGGEREGER